MKEIAPSQELRKWFHEHPEQWDEFERRYIEELHAPGHVEHIGQLRDRALRGTVTLLFSVRNEHQNHAVVLRDMLIAR